MANNDYSGVFGTGTEHVVTRRYHISSVRMDHYSSLLLAMLQMKSILHTVRSSFMVQSEGVHDQIQCMDKSLPPSFSPLSYRQIPHKLLEDGPVLISPACYAAYEVHLLHCLSINKDEEEATPAGQMMTCKDEIEAKQEPSSYLEYQKQLRRSRESLSTERSDGAA
ncbi:Hypothetical predicted protein [Scomber scombrus]|uniref:Uncharacterized protein n=1 Tax=Scomber scombrus TaxID=13677 RepID=A0AAV1Q1P4_SCOSC